MTHLGPLIGAIIIGGSVTLAMLYEEKNHEEKDDE